MGSSEAIVDELGRASQIEEVWRLLVDYFQGIGFGAVGYVIFGHSGKDQSPILFAEGFPPALVESFAALGYGKDAPALRLARTKGVPLLAGALDESASLTRAEREHRKTMFDSGLVEALNLPIFGPLGHDAVVILSEATSPDLYSQASWRHHQMVAQVAHLRVLEVAPETTPSALSERETEVLWLIAQGKSNGVIAQILSLSMGTVDTYLRRVFEKLNVADRTSAAVKAVSLGLIRI